MYLNIAVTIRVLFRKFSFSLTNFVLCNKNENFMKITHEPPEQSSTTEINTLVGRKGSVANFPDQNIMYIAI